MLSYQLLFAAVSRHNEKVYDAICRDQKAQLMSRKWTIEDDKGKVVDQIAGPGELYAQQAASTPGKLHQPKCVAAFFCSTAKLQ